MKLSAASRFFDRTVAHDAYSPRSSFKCQIEPLDLYRMDGARIRIRGMSTAPGVSIPPRRVIAVEGQRYIVSLNSDDFWGGGAIRSRYVLQGAEDSVRITSVADLLSGEDGVFAYASIEFSKYSTDERDSSDYHPQYRIFFGGSEVVEEGSVITDGSGTHYLVRFSRVSQSGMVDAISNRIDSRVTLCLANKKTYDPITDSYSDAVAETPCLLIRWQEHFEYLSQSSEKFVRGDAQLLVPSHVDAPSWEEITVDSVKWKSLSTINHDGYISIHVRRA